MNTNIKMLLSLVGVIIVFSVLFILQPQVSNRWYDTAPLFVFGVVLIPIVFGIFGLILFKEKNFFIH